MNSNQNSTPHYDTSLFFEISDDLLVISGYDGFFRKVNLAVSKTLGYTEEELLASPVQDFIHQFHALVFFIQLNRLEMKNTKNFIN